MRLDPNLARSSPMFGRPIFVLASPGTGAEPLVRALGRLPQVGQAPVPTHLFSQGLSTVIEHWVTGADTTRPQGITHVIDEQPFLVASRRLADTLLGCIPAEPDGGRVVEHTPDHIAAAEVIAGLFPDADLVHVVRDARELATHPGWEGGAGNRPDDGPALPGWRARDAARLWCEEQWAMLSLEHEHVHLVRIEEAVAAPRRSLARLAEALGLEATDDALAAASTCIVAQPPLLRATGRHAALVEAVGRDVLAQLGYAVAPPSRTATVELGVERLLNRGSRWLRGRRQRTEQ